MDGHSVSEEIAEKTPILQQIESVNDGEYGVEDNHRGSFITLTEGEKSLPEVILLY